MASLTSPSVPATQGDRAPVTVRIAAFSASQEALGAKILPRFGRRWFESSGQEIRWVEHYDGSGALADRIGGGRIADVAVLAHALDADELVASGAVARSWRDAPHGGIVSRSLVVLAVRKGNPQGIRDWADLARPGVRIVVADPRTSGSGLWSICALYGAALRGHARVIPNDPATARGFVARVLANVVRRERSASAAFRSFLNGTGDVAITYESELTLAWRFGHAEERVIPPSTLLVENAAVLVSHDRDSRARAPAGALLRYLWTREAQEQLAFCGLRPVDPVVAQSTAAWFPVPQDVWTIDDLGGWETAIRNAVPSSQLAPGGEPPSRPAPR